jgi:hypothetical protein
MYFAGWLSKISECGQKGETSDRRKEKIIFLLRLNDTTVVGHQKGSKGEKSKIFRAYVNNMSKGENIS